LGSGPAIRQRVSLDPSRPTEQGRSFLAFSRIRETSCLITDVQMPAMTGVQLYRHLIEAGYAIPTILITAHPNEVERVRAMKDGVLCYLRKPVDAQILSGCLHAALTFTERPKDDS